MSRGRFTTGDPVVAAYGRTVGKRNAQAFKQKYRFVPAKKQPPTPPGVSWWLNLDRASFQAEVAKRDRERQDQAARISYARPMDH